MCFLFCFCRSLDKNEYNHITATYFLLAERKLRARRQELAVRSKRPENLQISVSGAPSAEKSDSIGITGPIPCLLTVPRTPGDVPQVITQSNKQKKHVILTKLCFFSALESAALSKKKTTKKICRVAPVVKSCNPRTVL